MHHWLSFSIGFYAPRQPFFSRWLAWSWVAWFPPTGAPSGFVAQSCGVPWANGNDSSSPWADPWDPGTWAPHSLAKGGKEIDVGIALGWFGRIWAWRFDFIWSHWALFGFIWFVVEDVLSSDFSLSGERCRLGTPNQTVWLRFCLPGSDCLLKTSHVDSFLS